MADSPKFMSNIDIYDIAADAWYQQPTVGGPGALARGCAVVATSQDRSVFNIYYYGGYDGLKDYETYNDDVWILSLPSFMWMKVASGTAGHERATHSCVMPFPDQMMVIGGFKGGATFGPDCLGGGVIQLFNLSSGTWMTQYNSSNHADYQVPSMIYQMIGGSETGGATMTTPTPSGWADPGLEKAFSTTYPASKITAYYPYGTIGPNNITLSTLPATSGGGGTPSYLAPVVGTVVGLAVLTTIGVCLYLWRKRRLLRKGAAAEGYAASGTDDTNQGRGNRLATWVHNQQDYAENKAPTDTTVISDADLPQASPELEYYAPTAGRHELAHTQAPVELMGEFPSSRIALFFSLWLAIMS
jgi:hypothetical protein